MTGKQQTVGWLVLFLIIADMIDGGLRDAMTSIFDSSGATSSGGGGMIGPFQKHGQGVGPNGLIPKNPFPYRLNPVMPDIPAIPQGPLTGIPFSPVSINPHGQPPKPNHPAQPAPVVYA